MFLICIRKFCSIKIFSRPTPDKIQGAGILNTLGGALANHKKKITIAAEVGTPTGKRDRMFGRNMSKHMTELGMLGDRPMINITSGLDAIQEYEPKPSGSGDPVALDSRKRRQKTTILRKSQTPKD